MAGQTFVEKIFGARAGTIVFARPDIVLSHDNTASIYKTFQKMGGTCVKDPGQLMCVLDHNAPPTTAKLANDYQFVRTFVKEQGITRFHDAGEGICHQLMAEYARPGMIVVGSDSHTCTAGAFAAFAAGIDRTETAGLWMQGETWFRVPETVKITLSGALPEGVFAKDVALWLLGRIGAAGANYLALEFHGEGVRTLSLADRMTLANLASEMGAKSAAFPPDDVLRDALGGDGMDRAVWGDPDADHADEVALDLSAMFPVVACPHQVDNVKGVAEVAGTPVQHGLVGTCTNGRIEDLREAAAGLEGKRLAPGFQLVVTPASRAVYRQALAEGLIEILLDAGANVLTASCGPCLGTGQGIPADGVNVISTANRNFLGRMGNRLASIYLGSPAVVAASAVAGVITDPRPSPGVERFPHARAQEETVTIPAGEDRRGRGVWNYADVNHLNTDLMFAGKLTYDVNSSEPEKIRPHLFHDFDESFAGRVEAGDVILAGHNFGCGSSREHPAVGLAHAGVKAVVVKSVNRIFFRSAINQGLPLIVLPEAVEAYRPGDAVEVDLAAGTCRVGETSFPFAPLPDKLRAILEAGGLVESMKA